MLVKLKKKKLKRKWKVKVVWSHGLYSPRNSPGQNTGVGSLCLLQKIFPTQGLKACLLHCRWVLYQLNHKGSPRNSKDSGVKNWRDSGSNQHFEKCWFKFCPRIVLNAELPRTFNMQSSMLFLRGGGTYFVFSIFFFFKLRIESLGDYLYWSNTSNNLL